MIDTEPRSHVPTAPLANVRMVGRGRFAKALLLALTTVMVLLVAVRTGWFADDASYANLSFAIDTGRISLQSAAWASYSNWLATNGRWYPGLVVEKYAVFSIFQDRLAYKIFLVAISLVALITVWLFIRKLASEEFAFTSILGTIACFQIRGYHDPFIAYNGMIQIVTIFLFTSLAEFLTYAESGKRRHLIASLSLYVLACSTYEIAYIWAPLFALAALSRRNLRQSMVLKLPIAAIGFAFVAGSFILRANARIDPGSLYSTRLDLGAYVAALCDQITAALPLSYLIFNPSKIFLPAWHGFGIPLNPITFGIAAACAFVVIPTSAVPGRRQSWWVLAGLGILLVLLPSIEIPLLLKYQEELKPGLGYLPVFIEYIGVGILIALIIVRTPTSRVARWASILIFAGITSLSAGANEKLADILETPYLTSRVSFQQALSHGLLASVPSGATLAITPAFPWVCNDGACIDGLNTSDVVARLAHKNIKIVSHGQSDFVASLEHGSNQWVLSR